VGYGGKEAAAIHSGVSPASWLGLILDPMHSMLYKGRVH
jgi:hypothetical protein